MQVRTWKIVPNPRHNKTSPGANISHVTIKLNMLQTEFLCLNKHCFWEVLVGKLERYQSVYVYIAQESSAV